MEEKNGEKCQRCRRRFLDGCCSFVDAKVDAWHHKGLSASSSTNLLVSSWYCFYTRLKRIFSGIRTYLIENLSNLETVEQQLFSLIFLEFCAGEGIWHSFFESVTIKYDEPGRIQFLFDLVIKRSSSHSCALVLLWGYVVNRYLFIAVISNNISLMIWSTTWEIYLFFFSLSLVFAVP